MIGVRVLRSAIQELVFESLPRVEPEFPLRKPAVVQRDDPLPPLQLPAAACDGQHFVGAQGGQDDAQGDVAAVFLLRPAFARGRRCHA